MTEEQKEKLREVLKKYPKYDIALMNNILIFLKNNKSYLTYHLDKRVVKEIHPINQTLFNEVMEIVDETK